MRRYPKHEQRLKKVWEEFKQQLEYEDAKEVDALTPDEFIERFLLYASLWNKQSK